MRESTRNIAIDDAKKCFIYIGILNLSDMLLTLVATIYDYGKEINPLLSNVVDNIPVFILIKGVIPTFLLMIIYFRLKKGKLEDIKRSIQHLKLCYYWYLIILSSHFIWIFNSIFRFSILS